MNKKEYLEPLGKKEWSAHYNIDQLNNVIQSIHEGNVQIWAKELCNIIKEGQSCLEIGCGTGISTLWLAQNGRIASAMDYTASSVELVKEAAKQLNINVDIRQADAMLDLPYSEKEFDVIFQCGLLEHFKKEKQIALLKNWKRYCKKMVSMIPNAASVPYRVGKQMMESNGTWRYGYEVPCHSLIAEFISAGINVEREYTIGSEWSLGFLPQDHFVSKCYKEMLQQGIDLDEMMQGYLLVTIGDCE